MPRQKTAHKKYTDGVQVPEEKAEQLRIVAKEVSEQWIEKHRTDLEKEEAEG